MVVIEPIFMYLKLALKLFINDCYAEFHENMEDCYAE